MPQGVPVRFRPRVPHTINTTLLDPLKFGGVRHVGVYPACTAPKRVPHYSYETVVVPAQRMLAWVSDPWRRCRQGRFEQSN